MSFISSDELEKFSFEDCQIVDVKFDENNLVFTLEALIVKNNNSQNANYTDSYADTSKLTLKNIKVSSIIEEGYRNYDANDKLVSEVPDKDIAASEYEKLILGFKEQYLCAMECEEKTKEHFIYTIEVDTGVLNEAGLTDPYLPTYLLKVEFTNATVEWDRYLNKVQK